MITHATTKLPIIECINHIADTWRIRALWSINDGEYIYYEEEYMGEPPLAQVKRFYCELIEKYYNSDDINLVSISGVDIYLNPEIRFKLAERFRASVLANIHNVKLSIEGNVFELELEAAEMMLGAIVMQYAQAHDVKEDKLAEIRNFESIANFENYDFRCGYPSKLIL